MIGCIDGTDRYAGDPVRMDASLVQCLVDPGLIRAERAAALQHKGHDLKWKMPLTRGNLRCCGLT